MGIRDDMRSKCLFASRQPPAPASWSVPLDPAPSRFPRIVAARRPGPTAANRTGARVERFPVCAAFPVIRRANLRISKHCSGFTHVTAHRIAPLLRPLCHEALPRPIAQPSRSPASKPIDNALGGTFHGKLWAYCIMRVREVFDLQDSNDRTTDTTGRPHIHAARARKVTFLASKSQLF